MSDSTELILLRLGLTGILFLFVLIAGLVLYAGVRVRAPRRKAEPAAGIARLVVLSPARTGLEVGAEFSLAGSTSLGRDATNGIVLADASVSGQHAVVERTATGWVVRDLGSTNGTFVGNRDVDGRGMPLRDGTQLTVGAVTLRFRG